MLQRKGFYSRPNGHQKQSGVSVEFPTGYFSEIETALENIASMETRYRTLLRFSINFAHSLIRRGNDAHSKCGFGGKDQSLKGE